MRVSNFDDAKKVRSETYFEVSDETITTTTVVPSSTIQQRAQKLTTVLYILLHEFLATAILKKSL